MDSALIFQQRMPCEYCQPIQPAHDIRNRLVRESAGRNARALTAQGLYQTIAEVVAHGLSSPRRGTEVATPAPTRNRLGALPLHAGSNPALSANQAFILLATGGVWSSGVQSAPTPFPRVVLSAKHPVCSNERIREHTPTPHHRKILHVPASHSNAVMSLFRMADIREWVLSRLSYSAYPRNIPITYSKRQ